MLQSRVGVGVAVGKLIHVVLSVKAKGKRHDIVASVVRAAVVVDIFGRKPLPATTKDKPNAEKSERSFAVLISCFMNVCHT